jgi:hypothetical protein
MGAASTMLLCAVKASLDRWLGWRDWVAEGGQDRDGPLVVEGRLL